MADFFLPLAINLEGLIVLKSVSLSFELCIWSCHSLSSFREVHKNQRAEKLYVNVESSNVHQEIKKKDCKKLRFYWKKSSSITVGKISARFFSRWDISSKLQLLKVINFLRFLNFWLKTISPRTRTKEGHLAQKWLFY